MPTDDQIKLPSFPKLSSQRKGLMKQSISKATVPFQNFQGADETNHIQGTYFVRAHLQSSVTKSNAVIALAVHMQFVWQQKGNIVPKKTKKLKRRNSS